MKKGNSGMLRRTEKWYANTSVPHLVTNQLILVFFSIFPPDLSVQIKP